MAEHVVELTDETFAVATAKGVVLVDFYGSWCPPCKLLEPVIEKLAGKYRDKAVISRINIDDNSESAVDNTIENIPTILIFKDGEEMDRLFGAQKFETLAGQIERLLQ